MVLTVKNLLASAGDIRNSSSVLGSGRSPGGGNGNSLQYSYLENLMDRGPWWARLRTTTSFSMCFSYHLGDRM